MGTPLPELAVGLTVGLTVGCLGFETCTECHRTSRRSKVSKAFWAVIMQTLSVGFGIIASLMKEPVPFWIAICLAARPSRIPSLCTRFTRAGIEWRR